MLHAAEKFRHSVIQTQTMEAKADEPVIKTGLYGKLFPYGFLGEFIELLKLATPIVSLAPIHFNVKHQLKIIFHVLKV